jgi:hypothetical protein
MNAKRNAYQPKLGEEFMVPPDFDRTPMEGASLCRLDFYLCDKSVMNIIMAMYKDKVGKEGRQRQVWINWASANPVDADAYFSKPYCAVAVRELGYPGEPLDLTTRRYLRADENVENEEDGQTQAGETIIDSDEWSQEEEEE